MEKIIERDDEKFSRFQQASEEDRKNLLLENAKPQALYIMYAKAYTNEECKTMLKANLVDLRVTTETLGLSIMSEEVKQIIFSNIADLSDIFKLDDLPRFEAGDSHMSKIHTVKLLGRILRAVNIIEAASAVDVHESVTEVFDIHVENIYRLLGYTTTGMLDKVTAVLAEFRSALKEKLVDINEHHIVNKGWDPKGTQHRQRIFKLHDWEYYELLDCEEDAFESTYDTYYTYEGFVMCDFNRTRFLHERLNDFRIVWPSKVEANADAQSVSEQTNLVEQALADPVEQSLAASDSGESDPEQSDLPHFEHIAGVGNLSNVFTFNLPLGLDFNNLDEDALQTNWGITLAPRNEPGAAGAAEDPNSITLLVTQQMSASSNTITYDLNIQGDDAADNSIDPNASGSG